RVCGVDLSGVSPDDRLRRVVAEILLAYQGADDEHKVQSGAMGALPEEQQKLLRAYQREMVQFLSDTLKAVAPEVFEENDEKLRSATMSVFGMLNWYYMWNSGAGSQAREDYAELVATLTLNGVRGL
ncbi:MAG: TetR/AcrR family transcriptional regulator, partial [Pseudophaeobacter sp.]